MVVALMLVFGFKLARHSTRDIAAPPRAQSQAPDFALQSLDRQNHPPLRLPRQTSSPELLGNLVWAVQD